MRPRGGPPGHGTDAADVYQASQHSAGGRRRGLGSDAPPAWSGLPGGRSRDDQLPSWIQRRLSVWREPKLYQRVRERLREQPRLQQNRQRFPQGIQGWFPPRRLPWGIYRRERERQWTWHRRGQRIPRRSQQRIRRRQQQPIRRRIEQRRQFGLMRRNSARAYQPVCDPRPGAAIAGGARRGERAGSPVAGPLP